MKNMTEAAHGVAQAVGAVMAQTAMAEHTDAPRFRYEFECYDRDGKLKWRDHFFNTVLTAGKNDLLDKYFAGSAYTAAFYIGLISSVSFTAIVAADTAASHAGWLEAGTTNAPTFSQATRPALAFSAASAGSKATSAAAVFNITGTGTIKGAFTATINTLMATTGVTYSAGLFTGGDRAVLSGDTVNVSLTLSV